MASGGAGGAGVADTAETGADLSRSRCEDQAICVVSFNVHMWMDQDGLDNVRRIAELLEALNPDVVCLQEAAYEPGERRRASSSHEAEAEPLLEEPQRDFVPTDRGADAWAAARQEAVASGNDVRTASLGRRAMRPSDGAEMGRPSARALKTTFVRGGIPSGLKHADARVGGKDESSRELESNTVWIPGDKGRSRYALRWLARQLGLCWIFGGAEECGLAVLSRWEIPAFSLTSLHSRPGFRRYLLRTAVRTPRGLLRVATTHLDHELEPYRLDEADRAVAVLSSEAVGAGRFGERVAVEPTATRAILAGPHLLCGDFNALKRTDYDVDAWKDIAAVRRRNEWEAPRTDLLDRLLSVEVGYSDAADRYSTGDIRQPTCRFGTRIDYFLLSRDLETEWRGTHGSSYRVIPNDVSDHAAIMLSLRRRPWLHLAIPTERDLGIAVERSHPPPGIGCVRVAVLSDAEELADVINAAFDPETKFKKDGVKRTSVKEMLGIVSDRRTCCTVVTVDSEGCGRIASSVVGVMVYRPCSPDRQVASCDGGVDRAYFGMLAVHPAWQGRGIGSFLVRVAESLAIGQGLTRIECCTPSPRTELVSYYQRLGYYVVGQHAWPQPSAALVLREGWAGHVAFVELRKNLSS